MMLFKFTSRESDWHVSGWYLLFCCLEHVQSFHILIMKLLDLQVDDIGCFAAYVL